ASFSQPSIELAGRLGCGLIVAPFAAAMTYGGLRQVAELYHQTCARHDRPPGRLMCSYFIHFADTKAEEEAARARQIRYYKECVIAAFPGDPETAPPSYRYFIAMVERPRHAFQRLPLGPNADGDFGQRRRDHQTCAEEIAVEYGAALARGDQSTEQPRRDDPAECGADRVKECDGERPGFDREALADR